MGLWWPVPDNRARRSDGEERITRTRGIRGEKREETEAFPSLVSPFSFPRQFFARALLSDRMEQAGHWKNIVSSHAWVARARTRGGKERRALCFLCRSLSCSLAASSFCSPLKIESFSFLYSRKHHVLHWIDNWYYRELEPILVQDCFSAQLNSLF